MPTYRLSFKAPSTGQVFRYTDFEAMNDPQAMIIAQWYEGADILELWTGTRQVMRFDAVGASA